MSDGETVGSVPEVVAVARTVPGTGLGVRNVYGKGATGVKARAPGVNVGCGVCVGVVSKAGTKIKEPSTLKTR